MPVKGRRNITDLNIAYLNRMAVHSELTVSQNESTFTNDKAGTCSGQQARQSDNAPPAHVQVGGAKLS